jgi:hypothetical protein
LAALGIVPLAIGKALQRCFVRRTLEGRGVYSRLNHNFLRRQPLLAFSIATFFGGEIESSAKVVSHSLY